MPLLEERDLPDTLRHYNCVDGGEEAETAFRSTSLKLREQKIIGE